MTPKTIFKKGNVPWNKGKKGLYSFCSKEYKKKISISKMGSKNPQWKGGKIECFCLICKKSFFTRRPSQRRKYCSRKCVSLAQIGKHLSEETKQKIGNANRGKINYFWKGKHHSEETKKKVSLAKVGKKRSKEFCLKMSKMLKGKMPKGFIVYKKGNLPWNTGKKLSKEHCEAISKTRKGMPSQKKGKHFEYLQGKNNPRWKGGITPLRKIIANSVEWKLWREQIFKRDNYTCQHCKQPGNGNLHPHHIKPFSILLQEFLNQYSQFSPIEDKETLVRLAFTYEPFWDINNGITLCVNCHAKQPKHRLNKSIYKI